MTPFMVPARWSAVPKSVVRVMTGSAKDRLRYELVQRREPIAARDFF
jgi:hypothetical protein